MSTKFGITKKMTIIMHTTTIITFVSLLVSLFLNLTSSFITTDCSSIVVSFETRPVNYLSNYKSCVPEFLKSTF